MKINMCEVLEAGMSGRDSSDFSPISPLQRPGFQ